MRSITKIPRTKALPRLLLASSETVLSAPVASHFRANILGSIIWLEVITAVTLNKPNAQNLFPFSKPAMPLFAQAYKTRY